MQEVYFLTWVLQSKICQYAATVYLPIVLIKIILNTDKRNYIS